LQDFERNTLKILRFFKALFGKFLIIFNGLCFFSQPTF
jgi:hypothetical protein